MLCAACVEATRAAGVLTRCPAHPLKDGSLTFRSKRTVWEITEIKVPGRGEYSVTRLVDLDAIPKELPGPVTVNSDYPARPLRESYPPPRGPGFGGMEFRGMVRPKRGWHKLSGKRDAAGNGTFPAPKWWGDTVRGW